MKPEDIAIYLPCGIYGNVFNMTCGILVGKITTWQNFIECQGI